MASSSSAEDTKIPEATVNELIKLLWGSNLKEEVFARWSQGLKFSLDESTALLQDAGGPCAVIAPLQAFLIKHMLFTEGAREDFKQMNNEEIQRYTCGAMLEVFEQVYNDSYVLVTYVNEDNMELEYGGEDASPELEDGESSPKKRRQICHSLFHSHLRWQHYNSTSEIIKSVNAHFDLFTHRYGVLCFLYSILLTKGLEQVKNELEDPGEPLIDGVHGHGSQNLINLLITGRAVSNVWDGDKEVSGLKLQGICRQSTVGFLTQLEHLRYCEVGWYLKNPCYPVWVLGSETHLTVLFSKERALVAPESPGAEARRIFSSFDPEDCGFISTILLKDVLETLGLVSEPEEYIQIMRTKLDPEDLGVILISNFMSEFFPGENRGDLPLSFTVYHYNGIKKSNLSDKVMYIEGTAQVPENIDLDNTTPVNPVRTCLQTKWPTIELSWSDNRVPSLN